MPVDVQIPQVFRRHTNGARAVQALPGTLRQVLAGLDAVYPGLRGQLLTPEGALHKFVNVYVNQEDIRFLQELETPVADGDLVTILPAVAGGTTVAAGGLPAVAGGARPRPRAVAGDGAAFPGGPPAVVGRLPGQGRGTALQETA